MMQYKHWWACYRTESAYAQVWPQILHDSLRIVTHAVAGGINICGPDGYTSPLLDQFDGIRIGGDAAHGRHEQPLLLPAAHRNPHTSPGGRPPATTGSVDTARHPYDSVVAAVLLRCHQLLGHQFAIRSDGGWDTEWACGAAAGVPGARTVLADLFGPIPQSSPLIWPPQPVRAHPEGHQHA